MNDIDVRSGSIVALRVFDLAYAIDLAQVETLWPQHAGTASSRRKLSQAPSKAIAFDVPPVSVSLGSIRVETEAGALEGEALARIYDFGVASIALRFALTNLGWNAFTDLANALDQTVGPTADSPLWREFQRKLRLPLKAAMQRPTENELQEDHLLGIVHQWSESPLSAAAVLARVDLVPLLAGERRALSESARAELLKHRYSYYEDDLVVLSWDRAFIYEPRGDSDVADVLEVANAQLLELRYYDGLLDDELPRMYDLVDQARRRAYFLAPRRYAHLARRLYGLVAEVTELTEKADNALKVTEDVYLARVYTAALDLMRVPRLGEAVDRKLSIIRDTYAALYDEAASTRGELLEVAIVLLIVAEILMAIIWR